MTCTECGTPLIKRWVSRTGVACVGWQLLSPSYVLMVASTCYVLKGRCPECHRFYEIADPQLPLAQAACLPVVSSVPVSSMPVKVTAKREEALR